MTVNSRPVPATRIPAAAGLVAGALLIVYLVWGSTYLAIRVVVEEVPPLLGMGARYLAAGVLMGAILTFRGGVRRLRVTRRQLAGCAFVGLMLPVLGNGVVAMGESRGAPSGIAALLVATTPLMIMLFRCTVGDLPGRFTVLGVLLGFVGVGFLVLTSNSSTTNHVPLVATALVLVAATCWGFGSWIQPRLTLPADAAVLTVYEMLLGGVILLALGLSAGERAGLRGYPTKVWVAWAYLVVFGSMVAFTAYVWVLQNAPISLVATYAYVNPVVAVVLGALILDEAVTGSVLIGGAIIVVAVAVVISVERPKRPPDS